MQLAGGTDIHSALTYCRQIINNPLNTVMALITDLYEGGNPDGMRKRALEVISSGVQFIVLLALNDEGTHFTIVGMPGFPLT